MAKKNTSESDSTPRPSRSRAPRPSEPKSSPRRPRVAPIDTAADMRAAARDRVADPIGLSYDEIAKAAYHRYLNRGGQHGADVDDWVEAERELRARQAR